MMLHMPWWAILYSGLILASATGTIMINKERTPLYIVAELLSGLFAVMMFLFYYTVIPYPSSIMIVIGMLGFILFQEIWINRKLYGFLKTGDASPSEEKFLLYFTVVFFLVFLSPFLWVLAGVFKHFF